MVTVQGTVPFFIYEQKIVMVTRFSANLNLNLWTFFPEYAEHVPPCTQLSI